MGTGLEKQLYTVDKFITASTKVHETYYLLEIRFSVCTMNKTENMYFYHWA